MESVYVRGSRGRLPGQERGRSQPGPMSHAGTVVMDGRHGWMMTHGALIHAMPIHGHGMAMGLSVGLAWGGERDDEGQSGQRDEPDVGGGWQLLTQIRCADAEAREQSMP